MADETVKQEETAKTDPEREAKEAEATKVNAARTGIGTRMHVGRTRGKSSLVVSWEAFDESKPETLPTSVQNFIDTTKANETQLLQYLITGYNDAQYTAASDPLAEYVDYSWPEDAQTQFRLVVRNYSRGASVSLEDAVALIKPGFVKQFSK
jgi:hypothetical protein